MKLEQENKKLLRQVDKYRKRAYRLEKCEVTTPLKKTREILKGRKCLKEVRKRLLFGEVLKNQLKKNFSKGKKLQEKRNLAKLISGKVIKKYRMLSQIMKITSRRLIYSKRLFGNELKKRIKARRDIEDFLKLDENSRQCPGKRDTITRSKKKMQKRILTDTLINLHKKFVCNSAEYNKLSYSEFCKLRPFWIVSPNLVTSAEIDDCDKVEVTLPSFTGILKAHEISWTKEEENLIQVRRLTCTMCLADEKCHHYTIGQILIKAIDSGDSDYDDHIIDTKIKKARLCYSEVYSDPSDSDSSSSMENSFNDCLKNPKVNDYIIVKLSGKKMFHYYIGLVLQHDAKKLVVKFMKKSSGKKFIFPDIEDISSIHLKDIICVLNQPLVNNRQQYEFIINEKYMKLL